MRRDPLSGSIWATLRYAVGLPVFLCEIGLAGLGGGLFIKGTTFRDQLVAIFLLGFFGIQAWLIWRILLARTDSPKSRAKLIEGLTTLDPKGLEFYTTAANYFRKRGRSNLICGLFFISFGFVVLFELIMFWQGEPAVAIVALVVYLFFGFLGLPAFYHASATLKNLPKIGVDEPASRLLGLLKVAANNRWDPVAASVLKAMRHIKW